MGRLIAVDMIQNEVTCLENVLERTKICSRALLLLQFFAGEDELKMVAPKLFFASALCPFKVETK